MIPKLNNAIEGMLLFARPLQLLQPYMIFLWVPTKFTSRIMPLARFCLFTLFAVGVNVSISIH